MRLLVTGGAGFIGANVALGGAGLHPDWKITAMGSRYVFIVLYVWLEHHLSRGDYRRRDVPPSGPLAEPRMRPSRRLTKSDTH
jgi:hypothetical protein